MGRITKKKSSEWADVIASHTDYLRYKAFKFTRNEQDAEDLAQETIIKALASQAKFESGSNLKAWLSIMQKNIFINECRRNNALKYSVDITDHSEAFSLGSCQNDGVKNLYEADVNTAMSGLTSKLRQALEARADGWRYDQIANMLNVPVNSIRSRIHHGRVLLDKIITTQSKVAKPLPTKKSRVKKTIKPKKTKKVNCKKIKGYELVAIPENSKFNRLKAMISALETS